MSAAHRDVIKRNVGCEFVGFNQAIIRNARNPGFGGLIHGGGGSSAVFCDNHDDIHALQRQIFNLIILEFGVVVGDLHHHFRALFGGQFLHQFRFHRPAFGLEIRERDADLNFILSEHALNRADYQQCAYRKQRNLLHIPVLLHVTDIIE